MLREISGSATARFGRLGDLAGKVTAQLGGGSAEVIPSGMQAS